MEPDKPAPKSNQVLRNNLFLVLGVAAVLGALAPLTDGASAILFAFAYGAQVLVNLIIGLARLGKSAAATGQGPAPYFLSALLVLLIGFGACSIMMLGSLGSMH